MDSNFTRLPPFSGWETKKIEQKVTLNNLSPTDSFEKE